MRRDVDVVVLGLGVGGEEVAGRLARAGLSVVGIEDRLVGGECPYWGCIPTKMMIRATGALAEARRVPELAGSATVRPDWAPVARRIRDEATDTWDDRVATERLKKYGARFVRGRGRINAPGEVSVSADVFRASRGIVVATGTAAAIPPVPGLADVPYWTNRQAVETEVLPASLAILGGGAIGVEFAQMFARFGVPVTVVEAAERLLSTEEPEAGDLLHDVLTGAGITVRVGARVEEVRHENGAFQLDVAGEVVSAERLLVATGRAPVVRDIGLDAYGIAEDGPLSVDERLRVTDGLWAVGDVTGHGAFTHVAIYQARIAARDILGEVGPPADYTALPRVTFTDPEIGAVGLTERQAREAGVRVRTGSTQIPASARGWIHKVGNAGFIKLVEDSATGVLVGATSAGPTGGEVLGALAVAVHGGVPTAVLARMIYAYPTFHRAIEDALTDLDSPAGTGV
jgi:pyruvate/2-oxoglutarate dehydrogenase complex dihydrolipoamide dehydrogenase (E3) component